MDLRLAGQRVLITGASQGIGAGLARAFAAEGCRLVLVARSSDKLEELAAKLRLTFQTGVTALPLDLTRPDAADELTKVEDIDVLVNNAGAIPGGDLTSVSREAWRRGWELKVFGYIDLCRVFFDKMKAQGRGVIVNNIGASADYLDPNYIAGSSGNASLVAFTRALGSRSLDDGVRVLGVSPGPVATDRIVRLLEQRGAGPAGGHSDPLSRFPLGRPATVEEVADLIVFLASPRSSYTSGSVFTVDGGLSSRHAL